MHGEFYAGDTAKLQQTTQLWNSVWRELRTDSFHLSYMKQTGGKMTGYPPCVFFKNFWSICLYGFKMFPEVSQAISKLPWGRNTRDHKVEIRRLGSWGDHSVGKCLLYEDLSFYAQRMHKSHHGGTEGRKETDGLSELIGHPVQPYQLFWVQWETLSQNARRRSRHCVVHLESHHIDEQRQVNL